MDDTLAVPTPGPDLPLFLARRHRALAVGARVRWHFPAGPDPDPGSGPGPGGGLLAADPARLRAVVEGGGFAVDDVRVRPDGTTVHAIRLRTLPDFVGAGLRLLVVGLNPSEYAADAGVGFARPGNRFWPAALAAGIVTTDRDPLAAVTDHGTGMTDLVKRATRTAAEVTVEEFRAGGVRLAALVGWLAPQVVCVAGITGWRHAVDRRAVVGPQATPLGGRPVYVMPNPSGLNTHDTVTSLAAHLRAAVDLRFGEPVSR